jgi:hypothetical protein
VAWLPPELDVGVEPELRPDEELELDPLEVEPDEVEPVELEPEEVELEPELVEVEPVEVDALAVCVDPGRTRANAPAAATLATVTVTVAVLTLPRPRFLAAMAWRTPSPCVLLMSFSVGSRHRGSLRESSPYPLSLGTGARQLPPRSSVGALSPQAPPVTRHRARQTTSMPL